MKLITSIAPRRDGTVKVNVPGYAGAFTADENGDLVAEVADGAALAVLLATGNFQPFEERDMVAAIRLVGGDKPQDEGSGDVDPEEDSDADADSDDDEPPMDALPLEANTPPAAVPGKGRKAR